jgi:hypothetical protein
MLRTVDFWVTLFVAVNVYVVLRAFAVDEATAIDKFSFAFVSWLIAKLMYERL